ncbi:hypothetical protein ILUMI_06061, partial [Ignelater luminosus]
MNSFADTTRNPDRSVRKRVGFSNSFSSGSITQTVDHKGFAKSTILDGSAGIISNGTGISGNLQHQMGMGGAASVKAQVGIVNTPDHQVTAWTQHQRMLNKNLRVVGPPVNSVGVNYQNSSGAEAFISSSKMPGFPSVGTVGGSIPLYSGNQGNTQLNLGAQSNFTSGISPNHYVGFS